MGGIPSACPGCGTGWWRPENLACWLGRAAAHGMAGLMPSSQPGSSGVYGQLEHPGPFSSEWVSWSGWRDAQDGAWLICSLRGVLLLQPELAGGDVTSSPSSTLQARSAGDGPCPLGATQRPLALCCGCQERGPAKPCIWSFLLPPLTDRPDLDLGFLEVRLQ